MNKNTGFLFVLAYPETVVFLPEEWYSPLLRYIGMGKKNYLRAGHAALVLVSKDTGVLEYYDFGRYVTSVPNGRVRGGVHDRELVLPMKANIEGEVITNQDEILKFLATNPSLTHGSGKMIASVCSKVNYKLARNYIDTMQKQGQIRYAAFLENASNCARFVTTTLLASVTDKQILKSLKKQEYITPSTVGNVTAASGKSGVYEVSTLGEISPFVSTVLKQNKMYLFDKLQGYSPKQELLEKPETISDTAQWLSGIGSGAWHEIFTDNNTSKNEVRFRRFSSFGILDVDAVLSSDGDFDANKIFTIKHGSTCFLCVVEQLGKTHTLYYKYDFSLKQTEY